MSESKQFIYRDARGNITAREVRNISESSEYIQGICLDSGALRTFRTDRILEYVNSRNVIERLAYHIEDSPPSSPKPSAGARRAQNPNQNPEVCFTGFKNVDKEALIKLAEESKLFVRTSVTTQLDFLCCGYNAGPSKIEKARHQGVLALSENQFRSMLETGEIPEL